MRLRMEIISNLKILVFLVVTLNLSDYSYKPFNKFNAIPTYININSNQPASIVEQFPDVIIIRINRLSSIKIYNNKDSFNEALYNSGYKNELVYLDAYKHHINGGNNIGNKGHNYRGKWN